MNVCSAFLFARQLPTLPEGCPSSTIGVGRLNGRVRDGNGWIPSAITTGLQDEVVTLHPENCIESFG